MKSFIKLAIKIDEKSTASQSCSATTETDTVPMVAAAPAPQPKWKTSDGTYYEYCVNSKEKILAIRYQRDNKVPLREDFITVVEKALEHKHCITQVQIQNDSPSPRSGYKVPGYGYTPFKQGNNHFYKLFIYELDPKLSEEKIVAMSDKFRAFIATSGFNAKEVSDFQALVLNIENYKATGKQYKPAETIAEIEEFCSIESQIKRLRY